MDDMLINIIKSGNITIPMYLLKDYKKFNIKLNDFIFLMYLYNKGNMFTFDPSTISNDLGIDMMSVMNEISILSDKHFIEVVVKKNDKNITEEVISLEGFYNKLSLNAIEKATEQKNSTCFEFIEKEFGRTLSSIEYEIIKAWIESGNSDEIIEEAVKEAVFNGVSNLRYIDKILYEWNKKGIKTREDVEKNRKKHKKEEQEEIEEIFDYDWFEDDIDE